MAMKYNPYSGELDLVLGPGEGGDVTLTPDDGAAITGSSIDVLGEQAGTVPVMRTNNTGGQLFWENRTWTSQYVVDSSSTVGLRGTFSTIQAALTQAASDGMTFSAPRMIYVRAGTYTEDLSIPDGALIVGECYPYPSGGVITPHVTTITGTHTPATNGVFGFNNIAFLNTTDDGDTFSGGVIDIWFFDNCYFGNSGTGAFVNVTTDNTALTFSNCTFEGSDAVRFIGTGTGSLKMYDCYHESPAYFTFTGDITLKNVNRCGKVEVGPGTSLSAYNCSFVAGVAGAIIHNSSMEEGNAGILANCVFHNGAPYSIAANTSSSSQVWELYNTVTENEVGTALLFEEGLFWVSGIGTQGNVMRSSQYDAGTTLDVNDYYVGVTDTSSARTFNLPESNDNNEDQVVVFKDESGAAGTNNITITTASGTPTIDGATSYTIDTNYGAVAIKYMGSDEYAILWETKNQPVEEATVAPGSASAMTSNTPLNVTSIVLTPGRWCISALTEMVGNPTVTGPQIISISTTSATQGTLGDNSVSGVFLDASFVLGVATLSIPNYILNISSTTTVYLVAQSTFSLGALSVYGRLTAFRI
jgi:hypothetical protein